MLGGPCTPPPGAKQCPPGTIQRGGVRILGNCYPNCFPAGNDNIAAAPGAPGDAGQGSSAGAAASATGPGGATSGPVRVASVLPTNLKQFIFYAVATILILVAIGRLKG